SYHGLGGRRRANACASSAGRTSSSVRSCHPSSRRVRPSLNEGAMSPDVDFFAGLYNRQSCYADRLSEEQLQSIHVLTPLEDALRKWLQQGKDLVLAGNPGDGKTHFFRR